MAILQCGSRLGFCRCQLAITAALLLLSLTTARHASAQEIEPNEFVPLPDGTTLYVGYYSYGHVDSYNVARGPTIGNSGLETNIVNTRFVHFDYIDGIPAGVQLYQAFGSESGGHIGTDRLGSSFGAANTTLSAFIWPYSSVANKTYFNITGFLIPPDGSYDKNAALNVDTVFGGIGWAGDLQAGFDQGIGEHFSYDLGFDTAFFGDVTRPGGLRLREADSYRLQLWANWNWTRAFQTSIGWESILGGTQTSNGIDNGGKAEFERLRVATSLFVAKNAQVLLELNHDFVAVGGFKQSFGATMRVVYAF